MGMEWDIFLQEFEELMGVSMFATLISEIPSMLINVASYVLTALALYTIAKRRGINHPWLAWIPIANVWLLGCIADQYRSVALGEVKSRRKVLLGLEIAMEVIAIVVLVLCIGMMVSIFSVGLENLEMMDDAMASELLAAVLGPMVAMLLLCLPLLVIAIVYMVFYYIALLDIYKSCDSGNATLYLVLSILFSITQPIFLMICRNKDDGMPARQAPQPVFTPYQPISDQPAADPAEPWEQKEE